MAIFRLLSLTLITVFVLGMMNYIFLDKLSYIYLSLVLIAVSTIFVLCSKICLSYVNANEVTLSDDEDLINLSKSITFKKSLIYPRIYSFNASDDSVIVLNCATGWDILISKSTLSKLSFEQKKAVINAAIKSKENGSLYLKTYGMCLKVLILKATNYFLGKSDLLKRTAFIFIRPAMLFINLMSHKSLKMKIDRSLLQFKKDTIIELNLFEKIFLEDTNFDLLRSYNLFESTDVSYE